MKKTNKQRNLWTYGILGIILLGVVLIVISVHISIKHPVSDNGAFFLGYNNTNEQINEILEDTAYIQDRFNIYMQVNSVPTQDGVLKPYSPYLRPPHRDKVKSMPQNTLFSKSLNNIQVLLKPIDGNLKDVQISAFIQKLGDSAKQKVFIFNPQDNSYSAGEVQGPGGQILLGSLMPSNNGLFISPSFELAIDGRWIISLHISYQGKTAILEQEFFSTVKIDNETTQ